MPMKELIRTNDPDELSLVRSLLDDAGIGYLSTDYHTSMIEGSIGAIQQRILVLDKDLYQAKGLISSIVYGNGN